MSLFDTVQVELDGDKSTYQTKDLECTLDTYRVTADGIFIFKNNKYYKVPWICGRVELHRWDVKQNEIARRVLYFEEGVLK